MSCKFHIENGIVKNEIYHFKKDQNITMIVTCLMGNALSQLWKKQNYISFFALYKKQVCWWYIYCTEIFPLVYFNDVSSVLTSFILKALSYMHLVIIIARFCRKIECCSYSLKTTSVFWHRTVASFCSRHLWYELQRVNFHYLVLFFLRGKLDL